MQQHSLDMVQNAISDLLELGKKATIGSVAAKIDVSPHTIKKYYAHLFGEKPTKELVKPTFKPKKEGLPPFEPQTIVEPQQEAQKPTAKPFMQFCKNVYRAIAKNAIDLLYAAFFLAVSGVYFADCTFAFASFFNANATQKEVLQYAIPLLDLICILQYFKIANNMQVYNTELEANKDDNRELWLKKYIAEQAQSFVELKYLMLTCYVLCVVSHFFVKFHDLQITSDHVFAQLFVTLDTYTIRLCSAVAYTVFIGAIYGGSIYVFIHNLEKRR